MKNLIFLSLLLLAFACDCDVAPSSGASSDTSSFGQPPVENVSFIVAGSEHACALLENEEEIRCWGSNGDNQLDLGSAKNAQITLDASKTRFSKISAGDFFTCGILKDAPYKGIPVCFGKDGGWFNTIPNAPIKDIAAGPNNLMCFIKNDDTLGCVGTKIHILLKDGNFVSKKAHKLSTYGIDPDTGDENQDFSIIKFANLKVGNSRVCGQNANDGSIYCMGSNNRESGKIPPKVLDYAINDINSTVCLDESNLLKMIGMGHSFNPIGNISDPETLKYKKISSSLDLITSAGNFYDDGLAIPENTLVTHYGKSIEGVLDSVTYYNKPDRILCILNINKKIEKMKSF
jgi:hypothetical protein